MQSCEKSRSANRLDFLQYFLVKQKVRKNEY